MSVVFFLPGITPCSSRPCPQWCLETGMHRSAAYCQNIAASIASRSIDSKEVRELHGMWVLLAF